MIEPRHFVGCRSGAFLVYDGAQWRNAKSCIIELAIVSDGLCYNFDVWYERKLFEIEALCQQRAIRANIEDPPLTERHIGNNPWQCSRAGIVQGNHLYLGQQRRLHNIREMVAIRQKGWEAMIGFSRGSGRERDWSTANRRHSKQTGGTGPEDNVAAIIPGAPSSLLDCAQVHHRSSGHVRNS